jgi:hypothetical protein
MYWAQYGQPAIQSPKIGHRHLSRVRAAMSIGGPSLAIGARLGSIGGSGNRKRWHARDGSEKQTFLLSIINFRFTPKTGF